MFKGITIQDSLLEKYLISIDKKDNGYAHHKCIQLQTLLHTKVLKN